MGINTIGAGPNGGLPQLTPSVDIAQNAGQQYVRRFLNEIALPLLPGQTFLVPPGQWQVVLGRYLDLQWFDQNLGRWLNYPTQPGQMTVISSDWTTYRVANSTGTPIGATITNCGAGNATNGANTVGITPSAGNSTWGTLVGGSVNTTVIFGTSNGNYALAPIVVWSPASNQTLPFIPPRFTCTISANAVNAVTAVHQGAGLTAAGTLSFIQQPGDTNPGGANITLNATLTNSGNLLAMWPLTQGTNLTAVPTFTFNVGGGMAATAIMNFTVTNAAATANAGANYGANQGYMVVTANASLSGGNSNQIAGNQNIQIVGNDVSVEVAMPRMAWLAGNSNAAGNASNANLIVVDGGKNIQAVPTLAVIAANGTGANIQNATFTAVVGGVTDTLRLLPI